MESDWSNSVEPYHRYGLEYPQYRENSEKIVKLADIQKGDVVVDLACGTGFTTKQILVENPEKVFCVDSSGKMLQKAKKFIESDQAVFSHSKAEDLPTEPKADKIICNSAFWYFDISPALDNISEALKEDGVFTFNLNPYFLKMDVSSHRKPVVDAIIDEMESRGISPNTKAPEKIAEEDLEEKLRSKGFEIFEKEVLRFEGASLEDSIDFFRIPAVSPLPQEVPDEEREEILEKAKQKLDGSRFPVEDNVWKYFKVRKVN
jgi:ubiquinone/menaquinone biosynthesis C-methylase UbiE